MLYIKRKNIQNLRGADIEGRTHFYTSFMHKKKLKHNPIRDQQAMEFCSNSVGGDVLIFLLTSDKTSSTVLN